MNKGRVLASLAAGALLSTGALAQDAVKVASHLFKVLAKNDKVRVLEVKK